MLQNHVFPTLSALLTLCFACSVPEISQKSSEISKSNIEESSWVAATAEIDEAAQLGDFDRALLLLENIEAEWSNDARWQNLYSQFSILLFETGLRDGGLDATVMDGLLVDAADAARLALADKEVLITRITLTKALRLAGDTTGAVLESAPLQLSLINGSQEQTRLAALSELGQIALAVTAEAVRGNLPMPRFHETVVQSLREAMLDIGAATMAPSADLAIVLSDLHAWAGRTRAAREVLIAALIAQPESASLHARLKRLGGLDTMDTAKAMELVLLAQPTNALVLWRTGEARYYEARTRRASADFILAFEALDRAEDCFQQAMAQNPDFETSCRTWLHIVRTQRGWCWREDGEVDKAAEAFLTALAADKSQLEPESKPETLRLGIDAIVWDYFTAGGGNDRRPSLERLADGKAFLERVLAVHDQNPSWFNNLGFACRDLGTAAEAEGRASAAREYFEQSWAAYGKCVNLANDDVRLINDRALIAVYYLGREWVTAESELHRAIGLGEQQLAAMGDDVSEETRRLLSEAVGDAWENLAYHDLHNLSRVDRVEKFLSESVRHYPFKRRDGVARLRELLTNTPTE